MAKGALSWRSETTVDQILIRGLDIAFRVFVPGLSSAWRAGVGRIWRGRITSDGSPPPWRALCGGLGVRPPARSPPNVEGPPKTRRSPPPEVTEPCGIQTLLPRLLGGLNIQQTQMSFSTIVLATLQDVPFRRPAPSDHVRAGGASGGTDRVVSDRGQRRPHPCGRQAAGVEVPRPFRQRRRFQVGTDCDERTRAAHRGSVKCH